MNAVGSVMIESHDSSSFSTGIGTIWDAIGVTGTESQNCPYKGVHANAEYQAISGCSVVPTENHGTSGDGTFCEHWDEACLGTELMTGYLGNGGRNPLSRITIASLEDLGYTVDYSPADSFGRSDLGSGCTCNRRRSVLSMSHGETRQLGLGGPGIQSRRLSQEMYQFAVDYGRNVLAERRAPSFFARQPGNAEGIAYQYVGDQVMTVVVMDGDGVYSVVVRPGP